MAKLEVGKFCPLIKEDCKQLACSWFAQVRGKNPQTGVDVDEWACAIVWMPLLSINVAQEARQGAAATESFRNAVVGAAARNIPEVPTSSAVGATSVKLEHQDQK